MKTLKLKGYCIDADQYEIHKDSLFILENKHRGTCLAWLSLSVDSYIDTIRECYSQFVFDILRSGKLAICTGQDIEVYDVQDAPTLLDSCKLMNSYDLAACHVMTIDEVIAYINDDKLNRFRLIDLLITHNIIKEGI